MLQQIEQVHDVDKHGNPAGGHSEAMGMQLFWQNGPLGRGAERQEPNGCFVETVVKAAMDRLEFYQAGRPYQQMRMIKNEPKNHE